MLRGLCVIILAVVPLVSGLTCYSCLHNGCQLGNCTGDMCMDEETTSTDGKAYKRGCFTALAGDPPKHGCDGYLIGYKETERFTSRCTCKGKDYCMKSKFDIADGCTSKSIFKRLCRVGDDEEHRRIVPCRGDRCIYAVDDLGLGNENGNGAYNPDRVFLPHGHGCVTSTAVEEACYCDNTVVIPCNSNRPSFSYPNNTGIECFAEDAESEIAAGTICAGDACYLKQIYSNGNYTTQKGCRTETSAGDSFCTKIELPDWTEYSCVCRTAHCNKNITTAIDSATPTTTTITTTTAKTTVMNPTSTKPITPTATTPTATKPTATKPTPTNPTGTSTAPITKKPGTLTNCYACSFDGCEQGNCTGDMCIDEETIMGKDTVYRRGCFSTLAGSSAKPGCDGYLIGYEDNERFTSRCTCESIDYCMRSGFVVADACTSQGLFKRLCDVGDDEQHRWTVPCRGDRCVYAVNHLGLGNENGNGAYNPDRVLLPHGAGCVTTTAAGEACYCDNTVVIPCNSKRPDFSYPKNTEFIECYDGQGNKPMCRGSACYLREVSKGGNYNMERGCRTETSLGDSFCTKIEFADKIEYSCVCRSPHCNENVTTAINSFEVTTTTEAITTTKTTTTPTTTTTTKGTTTTTTHGTSTKGGRTMISSTFVVLALIVGCVTMH